MPGDVVAPRDVIDTAGLAGADIAACGDRQARLRNIVGECRVAGLVVDDPQFVALGAKLDHPLDEVDAGFAINP